MESLAYYLVLLACPLMIIVLLFFMKGMVGENNSNKKNPQVEELKKI